MKRERAINQNLLVIIALLLVIGISACGTSRQSGGMSMPRKQKPKKCNCPKWTDNTPASIYKFEWHA